jgi:kumamolisin
MAFVATNAAVAAAAQPMRRAFLLGLPQRGNPVKFATQVSNPSSRLYRRFLSVRQYQQRFSATRANQQRVLRYLAAQKGVVQVELGSGRSVVLAVLTEPAGQRIFCAKGGGPPTGGLCVPRSLRRVVRVITAGEAYPVEPPRQRDAPRRLAGTTAGKPSKCNGMDKARAFTPRQLSTAYGVNSLHARGLKGAGVRVDTLSGQEVDPGGFKIWAHCYGLKNPSVRQIAMPGGVRQSGSAPDETVLDVEALASLAPRLASITPIFVPVEQSFTNSFVLFMFGALDASRQGGRLPDILSISDGVCERRYTSAQLRLGERLLTQAAALGITTLAASGDLGFRSCFTNNSGAMFPSSSPFTTSVGGTSLKLTGRSQIASQIVWSTFAMNPKQGVGTGGGPSNVFARPSFQRAPGIARALQRGRPARLAPDIAAMASFKPGISTYDIGQGGWGIGGGTSAATPLEAAIVALVLQQERKAGRPRLGSLPPLLYQFARGRRYHSIFYDITKGTSSRKPKSALGKTPAGGAAQRGYDLATGLGSLKATAFARAVASLRAARH